MKRRAPNKAGFTLVEVLVALFIFSILSSSTLGVLTTTLRAKEAMETKSALVQKRSIARILMKADFANALPIAITDEFGQPKTVYFAGGARGDERLLVISRAGWENPGGLERRSDLQAVDYILKEGVLVRRVRARFNPIAATPEYEQALIGGIDKIEMSFFDGRNWQDNWHTGPVPIGRPDLPKLASIELAFDDGSKIKQIFLVGADQ